MTEVRPGDVLRVAIDMDHVNFYVVMPDGTLQQVHQESAETWVRMRQEVLEERTSWPTKGERHGWPV
jgi:hypothetical protein